MVHLWQYSDNAGIASLLMLLPVLVRYLRTCSEEVGQVLVKSGTF